jgi:hypothetical protein
MGQAEVIEYLEKNKGPKSRKQIADAVGCDAVKASHVIRKLLDRKEIKCIEVDRKQAGKMLGLDRSFRRMRFYYI